MSSLVESMPWQAAVIDKPPVKLDYEGLEVPEGVELTFVGTAHDSSHGLPEYTEDMLRETDVLMLEFLGHTPAVTKLLQRVSLGDFKARQKTLESNALQVKPEHATWVAVVYKALFMSRVRVSLLDYPKNHPGFEATCQIMGGNSLIGERSMPDLAARDKFILRGMANEFVRLRQEPKFAEAPVRALMLFGAGHYGIHDAFAEVIAGDTTSSSRLLFESGADHPPYDAYGQSKAELAVERNNIVNYQNWLRTPTN